MDRSLSVKARGLLGVASFPPCRSWELHSGHQAWGQVPFPLNSVHLTVLFVSNFMVRVLLFIFSYSLRMPSWGMSVPVSPTPRALSPLGSSGVCHHLEKVTGSLCFD